MICILCLLIFVKPQIKCLRKGEKTRCISYYSAIVSIAYQQTENTTE